MGKDEDDKIDYNPYDHRADKILSVGFAWGVVHFGVNLAIGPGLMGLPLAFSYTGLIMWVILTIVICLIYAYCMHVMVTTSLRLCRSMRRPRLAYDEVVHYAVLEAPERYHKFARCLKAITGFFLVLGWLGCSAVYSLFVAKLTKALIELYKEDSDIDVRLYVLMVTVIILWFVPAAPKSCFSVLFGTLGSCFMLICLALQILLIGLIPPPRFPKLISSDFDDYNLYLGLMCFTLLESVGSEIVMDNIIEKPDIYVKKSNLLLVNCLVCTVIKVLYGSSYVVGTENNHLLLYIETSSSLLVLPLWASKVITILMRVHWAFYMMFEILWRGINNDEKKILPFLETCARWMLGIFAVFIAILVPSISALMGFFGVFCFCVVGFIIPPWVDILVRWNIPGWGPCWYRFWLDLVIFGIGVLIWIVGTAFNARNVIEIVAQVIRDGNGTTYPA